MPLTISPICSRYSSIKRIALGLLDLLDNDLLCRLGADSADLILAQWLAIEDGLDSTVLAIELNGDIGLFTILTLRSGLQRRLDRDKYQLRVDILLAMERIDVSKDVLRIHDGGLEKVSMPKNRQKNCPNLGGPGNRLLVVDMTLSVRPLGVNQD